MTKPHELTMAEARHSLIAYRDQLVRAYEGVKLKHWRDSEKAMTRAMYERQIAAVNKYLARD